MVTRRAPAALAVLVLFACVDVLDIEEAHVDPRFSAAGSSGAAQGGGGAAPTAGASGAASSGGVLGGAGDGNGGEGSGSGGDSGSEGGNGGSDGPPPTLCEEYCTTVTTHCDLEAPAEQRAPQYGNYEQCLLVCALLDPGEEGDIGVNTAHCRLRQARQARYELNVCPLAGVASGSCGTKCDGYCALMMGACNEETTAELFGDYYFQDLEQCLNACAQVPDTQPFTFVPVSEHSLQCRMYHLLVTTDDSIEHCEHAIGQSICVEP